jgi:hypothetical protein
MIIDTTLKPICFNIKKEVDKNEVHNVGPETFKKYEYILYLMAQLSRIVYCDSGISRLVINESLGLSNDVVNKTITKYDALYSKIKTIPISNDKNSPLSNLMKSYVISESDGLNKYATYISNKNDLTCLFINASKVIPNKNSILKPNDLIISFKGSSTIKNFKDDLQSQFTPTDINKLLAPLKITVPGSNNMVAASFVNPLVEEWNTLVKALTEHLNKLNTDRIFITGHSLGGAYASLFTFILAEAKISNILPILNNIKSFHIISYGAPTLLSDSARNTFNRHLDSGLITLDRVVSQKVPSLIASTQLLTSGGTGLLGPNDVVATIPAGYSHPGYRPLATEFRPEANGRPYSMENIRKLYGVTTDSRYREKTTWPFDESVNTPVVKDSTDSNLDAIKKIEVVPENESTESTKSTQIGGESQKSIYSKITLNRMPNFVSVAGSSIAWEFAHAEYMGMTFYGCFRLLGMKNPSIKDTAYFSINNSGVNVTYITQKGGDYKEKYLKYKTKYLELKNTII